MHVEGANTVQLLIDIMVCLSNICCHDCCQYINVLDIQSGPEKIAQSLVHHNLAVVGNKVT